MRIKFASLLLIIAAVALAACKQTQTPTETNSNAPTASVMPANSNSSVASAHGGGLPPGSAPSLSAPANLDTSALDARIAKAEAKVKSGNATDADKKALADAYIERANLFYNAGVPMYYKFALRDFRLALKYQPDNAEAKEKRDMIVSIYQSMGRPVPDLGNEQ